MCMMLVSHMVDIYMEEFETNKQVPVISIVEKRLNNSSLLSFTNRYGNGITMDISVFFLLIICFCLEHLVVYISIPKLWLKMKREFEIVICPYSSAKC